MPNLSMLTLQNPRVNRLDKLRVQMDQVGLDPQFILRSSTLICCACINTLN
jgi:hypothetical protein